MQACSSADATLLPRATGRKYILRSSKIPSPSDTTPDARGTDPLVREEGHEKLTVRIVVTLWKPSELRIRWRSFSERNSKLRQRLGNQLNDTCHIGGGDRP
jgi:hypothetical protein